MTGTPDSPAGAEMWQRGERALWGVLTEGTERRWAVYVEQLEALAELWGQTTMDKDDRRSMVADLMVQLRLKRGPAREMLRHAELLRSAVIREAAHSGVLSVEHLNVIDATLKEAPVAERDKVEATLVENAATFHGQKFEVLALRILQNLDQDGKAPDDRELREPKRELHLSSCKDGSVRFWGRFDPESGALLGALVSPLAKPTTGQDPRTTAERQGDALAELIELASMSEDLPEEGGERPHLALTMSLKDFAEQKGLAEVEGMGPMNAASALRIACDSTVMRAVLKADSEVLDIGRLTRTIPKQIRRALIIRDRGCAFPGCCRRPRQCHGHHVQHWAQGGRTSLDNLVLLCGEHHRLMHHGHWTVAIKNRMPVFDGGWAEAA